MARNRTIYVDPSYQETTMQDFVINRAKTHQQHTATVEEDSLTKRFTRRTVITKDFFIYTRRNLKYNRDLLSRRAETTSFLQEVQACLAVRDL